MKFGKGESAEVSTGNRKFPRLDASCVIDYRSVGDDPRFRQMHGKHGFMQNISGGGVCVVMSEKQAEGEVLALNINLPGFPNGVIALGEVRWCNPRDASRGAFEVGIEFWWVGWNDQGAQEQIRTYIADRLTAQGLPVTGDE